MTCQTASLTRTRHRDTLFSSLEQIQAACINLTLSLSVNHFVSVNDFCCCGCATLKIGIGFEGLRILLLFYYTLIANSMCKKKIFIVQGKVSCWSCIAFEGYVVLVTDREGWEMDLPAPAPPSQPLNSLQTSVAASQHGAALWDRGRTRLSTAAVISLASYFMDSIWNISSSLRLRFISHDKRATTSVEPL